MTARTTLDLLQIHRSEPESYDFDLTGCEASVAYIRDRLPNADDARAKYLQAEREFHAHNRSES